MFHRLACLHNLSVEVREMGDPAEIREPLNLITGVDSLLYTGSRDRKDTEKTHLSGALW